MFCQDHPPVSYGQIKMAFFRTGGTLFSPTFLPSTAFSVFCDIHEPLRGNRDTKKAGSAFASPARYNRIPVPAPDVFLHNLHDAP